MTAAARSRVVRFRVAAARRARAVIRKVQLRTAFGDAGVTLRTGDAGDDVWAMRERFVALAVAQAEDASARSECDAQDGERGFPHRAPPHVRAS